MRRKSPFWLVALFLLGLAALLPLCTRAQQSARSPAQTAQAPQPLEVKRLILKDGSYQPIMKYEKKGDRVRYLSAERFEWEEIPNSLVDWDATMKYAEEAKNPKPSQSAREVDAEAEAERKREDAQTPLVAPGIRLPFQGGVYLLDVFDRQAQLVEIAQNGSEVNRNTKGNILRAVINPNPLAGARQTIELPGLHARVQSHVPNPYFYIDIDQDQDDKAPHDGKAAPKQSQDRFRIVRVQADPKKKLRVVGNIKVAIYGKVSESEKLVPANVEAFSGPWIKITPAEPLEPGEYALVEMLGDNQMNLYVWDFGVDPKAPANPGAWKPEPVKGNSTGTDKPPVLDKRK